MNDSIKIFIQQNRHAFDPATPGAHGWEGVARLLQRIDGADSLEQTLLLNRVLMDTTAVPDTVWGKISLELDAPADPLESFIQNNRNDFDLAVPDERIWSGIQGAVPASLDGPKNAIMHNWSRTLLRIAASLTLLLSGVGAGYWYANQQSSPKAMAMSEVSNEYAELEQHFQRDISVKKDRLAQFTGSQPLEVNTDLDQLDAMMAELRQELAKVPQGNREQVLRAMIETYEAKAKILQKVLERLEKSNPENNTEEQHDKLLKNI